VSDGFHLWSERYDRELTDVFEVQDEIARTIAEKLKVTLFESPLEKRLPQTKNVEANFLTKVDRAVCEKCD